MSKQKRKGINGKDKGMGFELKVRTLFTDWSGVSFKRVPLSGGWDKDVVGGDIFCVAEYDPTFSGPRIKFPFSIECKNDESWDFTQLFKPTEKCPIKLYWQQAVGDADATGKVPLLVFTQNWVPDFVMVRDSSMNQLAKINHSSWKCLTHMTYPMSSDECVVILTIDTFFEWVTFEQVLRLSK